MSMSKKIYSIILLLIVVALAIMGIGIYSINQLSEDALALGRQGKRAVIVSSVDHYLLQRQLIMRDIIATTSSEEMTKLINGPFKAVEDGIVAESEEYVKNFPSDPVQHAALTKELEQLFTLWDAYVKTTAEVAALSVVNSRQEAMVLNDGLRHFFDQTNDKLLELANLVESNDDPDIRRLAQQVRDGRASLLMFRLTMVRYLNSTDPATFKAQEDELKTLVSQVDNSVKTISQVVPGPQGGALATEIYQSLGTVSTPPVMKIIELININANGRANALYAKTGEPQHKAVADFASSMLKNIRDSQDVAIIHTEELSKTTMWVMITASAVGIIVGAALAIMTISRIIGGLNRIIEGLTESSSQVNSAAGQISDSSQTLAEGSTEQAASLEESSSALEEMASMTRQNADNASKTNDTMINVGKMFTEGSGYMSSMNEAMSSISESSEQISRIIKTIEDIAFQTNLLALNAAVEAARAGEAGKGFAVVADEVRNLAQRSAQAARDTTTLIESTVDRVHNGSDVAKDLNVSFTGIQESAAQISRLISEITAATNEQAQGVDQVNTAVAQMDKVTQNNAATAEEAASAAEELSAQAAALNGMVENLVSMVEGRARSIGNSPRPSSPPRPSAGGQRRVMQVRQVENVRSAPSASSSGGGVKMLAASEVIPLGDGDDF